MDGLFLTAAIILVLGLAWVWFVPDEHARIRGLIWVWIAMPVVAIALAIARRIWPGLY